MIRPLSCTLLILALMPTGAWAADDTAPAQLPPAAVDPHVPVSAKKTITINARSDADVASRELWYSRFESQGWGPWLKHGLTFGRDTPIVWEPPEGHWRIYVRIVDTSGLAMPVPDASTRPEGEFIIDRTAPTVTLSAPADKAKIRGGHGLTVRWQAADPNIAANPVTLLWSRGGDKFDTVATNLPNTGTYEWNVPRDMTTTGTLRIQVVDRAGNVGTADAKEILVDSIAPNGHVIGPAVSNKTDLTLDINATDAGPAGLASVQLWVSQDAGQTWTPGPTTSEPPFKTLGWKAGGDGRYLLALVATDQAGNQSPLPQGRGEGQFVVLVDTVAPQVSLTSACGIADAANPGLSRSAFKPGDKVMVQFTAKDTNLAANPITVFMQTDADKPWQKLGENLPADQPFAFVIPATATRRARIRVTAVDLAGNVGEAVSPQSFIIDTQVQAGTVSVDLN